MVIRLPEMPKKHDKVIAEAIMSIHRNARTVLVPTGPVYGDFRVRGLKHIAGERKTVTTHVESGCSFSVDLDACYFSPRLSYERTRIAKQVKDGETVLNMFAGVGCFSLIIAKHSNASRIYSIDVNPLAFQFMQENIRANGFYGRIFPVLGDAKEIIEKRLCHAADRVLMPLPQKALEYLPLALLALKSGEGWIHYYDFEHADRSGNAVEKTMLKVAEKLATMNIDNKVSFGRVVRSVGPRWFQVVLDIAVRLV